MQGKIRTRLVLLVALAALAAVIVPAGLAFGGSEDPVFGPGEIIYLSMGNPSSQDVITFGDLEQQIPTKKNDCTWIYGAPENINTKGPDAILLVDPINAATLGENKDHIGTKGPNDGAGEPCALAAAGAGLEGRNEGISVELVDPDHFMTGFSVDVRLKFDSTIIAKTYDSESNQVGPVEGIPYSVDAADSGSDSADNYRFTYFAAPGDEFVRVEFVAQAGAFALGGGHDSDPTMPGAFDTSSYASQFQTGREYDGDLTCQESHTVGDLTLNDVEGTVTMHAMYFDPDPADEVDLPLDWYIANCRLKLFDDDVAENSLAFIPSLANTSARYTWLVTLVDQPITSGTGGVITSLQAQYNLDGDLSFGPTNDMLACNGQPIDSPTDFGQEAYDNYWQLDDLDDDMGSSLGIQATDGAGNLLFESGDPVPLLPDGETICYYSAGVTPTGVDSDGPIGTEIWKIYFGGDPGGFW